MATVRENVTDLYKSLITQRGRTKGQKFAPKTIARYVGSFMTVFDAIGDCAFDAGILEEYLEEVENLCTRRSYVIAVNHYVRNSSFSDDEKEEMQLLNDEICRMARKDGKKWDAKKRALQIQYHAIPFKDLLMTLAEGARKKAEQATGGYPAILRRAELAFALIATNPPLRTDYCNIILKDRVESIPPKTPYYHNGNLYFLEGSRVKTGNASPTLDVSECRALIEDFLAHHSSKYLFESMTNNAFSRMHRKRAHATDKQMQVMDHSLATDVGSYAMPVEFEDEMEVDDETEEDAEMAEEMEVDEPDKMSLAGYINPGWGNPNYFVDKEETVACRSWISGATFPNGSKPGASTAGAGNSSGVRKVRRG